MKLLLLVLLLLVPASVLAQAASPKPDGKVEMSTQQRRIVVRPGTPADTVEHDAEAAAAEVQEQRSHARARALTRPAPRRPDLDYDVKSGIQSQRLNDALRAR